MNREVITLLENNDFKLKFNNRNKKLILVDNNNYSYNLQFEEKDILLDKRGDTNVDTGVYKQLLQISNIVNKIQHTGKIGPAGPEGKRGRQGERGEEGERGNVGKGLEIDLLVDSRDELSMISNNNLIALVKNTMDMFISKDGKWNHIGNIKGERGSQGEKGMVGDKGKIGPRGTKFKFDYIFENDEIFNSQTNKLSLVDGIFTLTRDEGNLYQFNNGEWNFICCIKGPKGVKGDGLKIDIIVKDKEELLNNKKDGEFALVQKNMDLYRKQDNIWIHLGSLKGNRGSRGQRGTRGPKGNGLKIDYIFADESELIDKQLQPKLGDVALLRDKRELRQWENHWKSIGFLELKITDRTYHTITGAELKDVNFEYQDINKNKLRYIKYDINTKLSSWVTQNDHFIKLKRGKYKIKYNICWNVSGNANEVKDFLKTGILIFLYQGDKFIPNSVKFDKGFPITNTSSREFILDATEDIFNDEKVNLKIIIQLIGITPTLEFNLYKKGCFIEIDKLD